MLTKRRDRNDFDLVDSLGDGGGALVAFVVIDDAIVDEVLLLSDVAMTALFNADDGCCDTFVFRTSMLRTFSMALLKAAFCSLREN
jgi:hypothetical protein